MGILLQGIAVTSQELGNLLFKVTKGRVLQLIRISLSIASNLFSVPSFSLFPHHHHHYLFL